MATLQLTEGGEEFQVNYELLKAIARYLPRGGQYSKLAGALVDLDIPSLTVCLLEHDGLEDRYDDIWENGNREIRRELLQVDGFLDKLTDAQAQDIIDADDVEMLKFLAGWSERLLPDAHSRRLSRHKAKTLLRHILNHPDARVREAAAENGEASQQALFPVRECLEQGFTLQTPQIAAMRLEDVRLLEDASYENLEFVAEELDEIMDSRVQKAAASLLANHPDPSIRLAVAQNDDTPESILEKLAEDEDGDVACAAKKSLNPDWDPSDDDWEDIDDDEDDEDDDEN